ncbi:hypothetical protein RISK_001833 [Rhodopirellula islandica]|uniref:Uncharacterized protein n=1 Tax=Rhodopirellula islandica TaxID=595434 RepID=A0A0J1BHG9_RHOIS|nr:hypothetical protein RISK_001833 [Rhodopirellula islandica]
MIQYVSQISRSADGLSPTVTGDKPDAIVFRLTKATGQ